MAVHKDLESPLVAGAESRYEIRLFGGRTGGLGMCLGRGHDLGRGESTAAAAIGEGSSAALGFGYRLAKGRK